jgi:hypothetical protein
MKTEKELLELYHRMLVNTMKLHAIVQEPPDDYSFDEIKECINEENSQYNMNSLIEYVLDIKNKGIKHRIPENGLIPVHTMEGNEMINKSTSIFMCDLTVEEINEFYEKGFIIKNKK